jgi:hypothetical protein
VKVVKRNSISLLICLALLASFYASPQNIPAVNMKTRVKITGKFIRFDSLVEKISKQTAVKFSFNTNKVAPGKIIELKPGEQTLEEILLQIKTRTGIYYRIVGSHIILLDKQPAKNIIQQPGHNSNSPVIRSKPVLQKNSLKSLVKNGPGKSPAASISKKPVSAKNNLEEVLSTKRIPVPDRFPPAETKKDTMAGVATPDLSEESKNYIQKNSGNDSAGRSVVVKDTSKSTQVLRNDGKTKNPSNLFVNDKKGPADNETKLRSLTKLDLGLQGFGFTFEPRLGKKITMDLSLGAGGGYNLVYWNIMYRWYIFNPSFYFSVTPKFYYNLQKRTAGNKRMDFNAGNYIGLRIKYVTKTIGSNADNFDAALINAHWGMQRALGKRWTFNLHAGVGYALDVTDLNHAPGTVYPAVDFRFAYIFSKPK